MTTAGYQWALWAVGIVVLYGVLSRGLFLLTDTARQSLVDLAGEMIDSPTFPNEEKKVISSLLDTVHSAGCAWLMALLAIRILIVRPFRKMPAMTGQDVPPMLKSTYDSFNTKWAVATIGNSLAACIIFSVAMLGIAALRISFRAFTQALISTVRSHDHRPHHGTV